MATIRRSGTTFSENPDVVAEKFIAVIGAPAGWVTTPGPREAQDLRQIARSSVDVTTSHRGPLGAGVRQ